MTERCEGCSRLAKLHPFVGISCTTSSVTVFPVCEPCQRDPAHRRFLLKASFFTREESAEAIAAVQHDKAMNYLAGFGADPIQPKYHSSLLDFLRGLPLICRVWKREEAF